MSKSSCLLWITLMTWPRVASADPADVESLISQAKQAETDFDYDRANDLWMEVITHPDTSEAQRLEANLHAGHLSRAQGRDIEARMHYLYVLQRDADYKLDPQSSPKIRNFFELVRQEVKATQRATSHARVDTKTGASTSGALAPSPPPGDDGDLKNAPGAGLFWAGLSTGVLGLVGVALGGAAGMSYLFFHQAALSEPVQIDRAELYDQRDTAAIATNTCLAFGTTFLLIGAAVGSVGLAEGAF